MNYVFLGLFSKYIYRFRLREMSHVVAATSDSTNRLNGVSVSKSIIIGTYAFAKHGETSSSTPSSFRWTILVRSGESDDEDLSDYIRRIEFNLHSTFAQPRRVVEIPPFQVEEQGWGEFEIHARIYFQDMNERPLEVKHWLKLRPDEDDKEAAKIDYSKDPLVHEQFEEILFYSPHEWFYDKLTKPSASISLIPTVKYDMSQHPLMKWFRPIAEWKAEEEELVKKLSEIEQFLRIQISNHQSQILLVDSDYRAYRDHFFKYNISG
jgi:YEATS domain-containing protein 4